jgi:nucleoside-specific outer membrane channel protein Tsx
MKRTILALALVAATFGAFAQTPATTQKPAVHKSKSHKKAEVKKADKVTAPKTATITAPKADKKK